MATSLPSGTTTEQALLPQATKRLGIGTDPRAFLSGHRVPLGQQAHPAVHRELLRRRQVLLHYLGYGLLAAELRDTGEIVGRIGFLETEIDATGDAELHYHLAPTAWGNGLATEAARALLEWGFEQGRLGRVVAVIHPDNLASRRVAEKCGLTFWKEIELRDSGRFTVYHNRAPDPK